MGLVEKNSLLAGIHGSVGHLTIVHQNGKIIAKSKPVVSPKATPRRRAHRGKFGRASQWASGILREVPEIAAVYIEAAKGTELSAQNLAIADFMHGPVIEDIDLSGYSGRSGEEIRIHAKDGVLGPVILGVASAEVAIRNLAGAVLEKGKAEPGGAFWVYLSQIELPPTQIVQVEITVTDWPGNRASKTVPHLTGPPE